MENQDGSDAEDDIDCDVYDKYIGAKVSLDGKANGGGNIATVKKRKQRN